MSILIVNDGKSDLLWILCLKQALRMLRRVFPRSNDSCIIEPCRLLKSTNNTTVTQDQHIHKTIISHTTQYAK
jgi:hypothetical protein